MEHTPDSPFLHISTVLIQMLRDGADGHRGRYTLEYVKRNGERITIREAKCVRYEPDTQLLTLATPGGIRVLRTWAIVAFDGHEVFV